MKISKNSSAYLLALLLIISLPSCTRKVVIVRDANYAPPGRHWHYHHRHEAREREERR